MLDGAADAPLHGSTAHLRLLDFLDLDDRPSFIVQAQRVAYINPVCRQTPLSPLLLTSPDLTDPASYSDPESRKWASWLLAAPHGEKLRHSGHLWTLRILENQHRLVTGIDLNNDALELNATPAPLKTEFDVAYEAGCISHEHYLLLQNTDWASTSLGHQSSWCYELRHAVAMTLAYIDPCCLHWGPDLIMLYNEPYAKFLKELHPAVGISARVTFADIWAPYDAIFQDVARTGRSNIQRDTSVLIARTDNTFEETFLTFQSVPVKDGQSGHVVGVFNPLFEVTTRIISQRRLENLLRIGDAVNSLTPLDQFWSRILHSFDFEDSEVPFAAVYCRGNALTWSDPRPSIQEHDVISLQGLVGKIGRVTDLPRHLHLSEDSGLAAMIGHSCLNPELAVSGAEELLQTRPSIAKVTPLTAEDARVVVCPLQITLLGQSAWLILGVHDLRVFDTDYRRFIGLLVGGIETAAASLIRVAEERKGLQDSVELAGIERLRLSNQLEAKTKEAQESARRFFDFAKHASVSMTL